MRALKITATVIALSLFVVGFVELSPEVFVAKTELRLDSSAMRAATDSVRIPGTDVVFRLSLIPGGTFDLGSPDSEPGRDEDEGPVTSVSIEPFWMGVHEVTFDEYAIFRFRDRDSNESAGQSSYDADAVTRPTPPYEDPAQGMGDNGFPVVGMTQWAALQYAKWLSSKTGSFYRLPTEAEWEYACRAGSADAFAFGGDVEGLEQHGWYFANSDEKFHEVGRKTPNAWGLYDMHGNVSEWTLDQYSTESYASLVESPIGEWAQPSRAHPRSVRGGAFDDDPEALRCANRIRSSLNWKRRDPQ
ncbi:MAG: SUMF1/EgtB/PvdO family nonheme iron enzyme, partial [Rhodothermales bacterium]|nr:SUMF1/EgtB/PvdO family nonheme iron enzyme [Rhodothermales bacterium]